MSAFTFYFSTSLEDTHALDGFHLLQDHLGGPYAYPWDDFDYVVTFQIQRVVNGKREFFGRTKVLAKGYNDTSTYFKKHGVPCCKSYEIGKLLNLEAVVSLAGDVSYYQRLHKALGGAAAKFLSEICDASYLLNRKLEHGQWPGFDVALLRSGSMARAMLKKGRQIAAGRYEPDAKFEFEVGDLPKDFEPIRFRFDNERKLGRTNINLLIGRNGSGKSHVLRHVVDLVTGVVETNSSPYFHKVVVVAYSPFETFRTENQLFEALENGQPPADTREKMSRRSLMVNKYAYVGFKDPDGRFSLDWPKESSAHALVKILAFDEESSFRDTSRFKLLFDTLQKSIDFDALALTSQDGQRLTLTVDEPHQHKARWYADNVDAQQGIGFYKRDSKALDLVPVNLSSGQQIYSYLLPNLVAEVEDESLIILDEPELYLHPAMEVSQINMVKELLKATQSNAVVATHSSILAREVERQGVVVLRREGARTIASPPPFETFGQSVELIMGEAFDDYRVRKAYQDSLDSAAAPYATPQQAIAELAGKVGDEALAYLASKLANDDDELVRREPDDADDEDDARGDA